MERYNIVRSPLCQLTNINLPANHSIMYATRTCPNDILSRLQTDVTNLVQWFMDNAQKLRSLNDITAPVVINDTSLQNVNAVKYLGITLVNGPNLTWEIHINE